jgi:hypothetical protein
MTIETGRGKEMRGEATIVTKIDHAMIATTATMFIGMTATGIMGLITPTEVMGTVVTTAAIRLKATRVIKQV